MNYSALEIINVSEYVRRDVSYDVLSIETTETHHLNFYALKFRLCKLNSTYECSFKCDAGSSVILSNPLQMSTDLQVGEHEDLDEEENDDSDLLFLKSSPHTLY